jgi:hypothetical protein
VKMQVAQSAGIRCLANNNYRLYQRQDGDQNDIFEPSSTVLMVLSSLVLRITALASSSGVGC